MGKSEFEFVKRGYLKDKEFQILVSEKRRLELFQSMGYTKRKNGILFDAEKGIVARDCNGDVVNLNKNPRTAFVSGSHNFTKNVVDYSKVLAEHGKINFVSGS